jgi:hypothetical protein
MYLLIDQDNKINNIVVWDGVTPWEPNAGLTLVDYQGGIIPQIGWGWDGSNPIAPPEPEPLPVIEQVGPNVVA